MKKFLVSLGLLLMTSSAQADTCAKSLTGVFTSFQAVKICSIGVPIVSGNLTFSAATAKIIPGATSLTFRDNGDANSNIVITDAGLVTLRNDLVNSTAAKGVVLGEAARAANVTTATTLAAPIYVSAAAAGTDLAAFVGSGVSASGPVVDLFKTRATSGAATTIVNSADATGTVRFLGANGTTYDVAAQIVGTIDGTPGATNDMPGALDFQVTPDASTTPASALKLDNAKKATFGGNIKLSAVSAKFIPGATSLLVRDAADANTNLTILDAGGVTGRTTLTGTTGVSILTSGDFVGNTSGSTLSLQEATAGAACSGTLTANGATPVVTSTTCATTGSRVFLSRTSAETGTVSAWKSALSNGVSFSVTSEAADTGTYDWVIFHESP